jgi:hypothetical protein
LREFGSARVTGVDEQNAPYGLFENLVGMSENDRCRADICNPLAQGFRGCQRIDDVLDKENALIQRGRLGVTKLHADISVSHNSSHRSDLFQLKKDPRHPHISGVENMVDAFE